jgi:hypothetical protein
MFLTRWHRGHHRSEEPGSTCHRCEQEAEGRAFPWQSCHGRDHRIYDPGGVRMGTSSSPFARASSPRWRPLIRPSLEMRGRWYRYLMSHRTRWETPRGKYDEHSSKFSLSMKPKFNLPVGERNHLWRLLLADFGRAHYRRQQQRGTYTQHNQTTLPQLTVRLSI